MRISSGLRADRADRAVHRQLRVWITAASLFIVTAACQSTSHHRPVDGASSAGSVLTSLPAPAAQGRYDLRSLRRTYGFSASGTILPPAVPSPTPAVAVGLMTFDGEGNCTIADTINIGGTVAVRGATPGTYTVDPDGTGTITVAFPGDPGPTPLSFVIVENAHELRFVRTDLGVAEGVAKRQ